MIRFVADIVLSGLALSAALAFYRVVKGPTLSDRFVALDTIGIHAMAMIAVFSIRQGSIDFIDSILSIAVLSFVSTIAIAKFIVKGVMIDRRDQ